MDNLTLNLLFRQFFNSSTFFSLSYLLYCPSILSSLYILYHFTQFSIIISVSSSLPTLSSYLFLFFSYLFPFHHQSVFSRLTKKISLVYYFWTKRIWRKQKCTLKIVFFSVKMMYLYWHIYLWY